MSSITAILVSYNSASVITQAISALYQHPEISEIIVVDNNSSDNTIELIHARFAGVNVIENPRNEGFGRANNAGLAKVKTEFALLVNPDAIMQEGAIGALLAAAEKYSNAAILAPKLMGDDGKMHLSFKQNVFLREKHKTNEICPEGDVCAEYLSGAVWLVRMSALKTIGFFDANIFLYYEDDDLCIRARNAGYACVWVHDAVAMHLMGGSSGTSNTKSEFFKQQHMIWSRLYLEQKYHGDKAARKLAQKLQLEYALKAAFYALRFNTLKIARYRGRIAGVVAFNEKAAPH